MIKLIDEKVNEQIKISEESVKIGKVISETNKVLIIGPEGIGKSIAIRFWAEEQNQKYKLVDGSENKLRVFIIEYS